MLKIFKKFFHNPDKETIKIFEEKSKIDYDPAIFSSLTVLSLTDAKVKNLNPLLVFINLEILNLSHNRIQDISFLKKLTKLKIIDLRFNRIKDIPLWVFKLDKAIYWERSDEEQEGIFLEGNPLDRKLILKIKNHSRNNVLLVPIIKEKKKEPMKMLQHSLESVVPIQNRISLKPQISNSSKTLEIEQLIPLKRQHVAIFSPKLYISNFVDNFVISKKNNFKLHKSIIEYNKNNKIINSKQYETQEFQYIILIIKETECCLNPPILETISNIYIKSKIFLIIENNDKENIKEKITFFKTYNRSMNIIQVYHSFNKKSNDSIKDEIYSYLQNTRESNTLWRKSWITLRDEIENSKQSKIDKKLFQTMAEKHTISKDIIDDIFIYLKRVGSIKEYTDKSLESKTRVLAHS